MLVDFLFYAKQFFSVSNNILKVYCCLFTMFDGLYHLLETTVLSSNCKTKSYRSHNILYRIKNYLFIDTDFVQGNCNSISGRNSVDI